jgi:hypothetical protein
MSTVTGCQPLTNRAAARTLDGFVVEREEERHMKVASATTLRLDVASK